MKWRQDPEIRFKMEMQKILLSLDLEDGELRQLFNELEFLNKALKNCFEKMEVPSVETVDNRVVKRLHACFNADRCIATHHNARMLHGALRAALGCTCSMPHKGGLRLAWHTERWLSPAKFEIALSYRNAIAGSQREIWKHVKINVAQAMLPTPAAPEIAPKPIVPAKRSFPERLTKTLKRVRIQENTTAMNRSTPNLPGESDLLHLYLK
jgi:hypothetical protein